MSPGVGKLYLTRQVEFSAAHRLYREDWSEEENRMRFGKCANPFGHGHNYSLEATFEGIADRETGMVVHFQSLKRLLDEVVVSPLDHQHLNHVRELGGLFPTAENLIVWLWERLERATRGHSWKLHGLKLLSSSRHWVEYFGPER